MLTRTGWAAVVGGVLLIVAASALGYVELAALGIALITAVLLACAWVLYRPNLRVDRHIDPVRVTVGDPAMSLVAVHNESSHASLPLMAFDRIGKETVAVPLPRLRAGAMKETSYLLPTARRAVLDVGPLAVVRSDPFGLVRTEQSRGDIRQLFVHPRRHALLPLPASFERSLEGPTSDSAPRGSQAFHQLREYVPGDDRRMIHWKTSARTGTLMIRQHVDTSLPDLTVVLDNRRGIYRSDQFEAAVEIAASLVTTCAEQGFPVRLRTTDGSRYDAPMGQPPTTYFLDRLAGVELTDGNDLEAISQMLLRTATGFALLVISAHPSASDMRALTPLVRRFSAVIVVDADPDTDRRFVAAGIQRVETTSGSDFAAQWNQGLLR